MSTSYALVKGMQVHLYVSPDPLSDVCVEFVTHSQTCVNLHVIALADGIQVQLYVSRDPLSDKCVEFVTYSQRKAFWYTCDVTSCQTCV